MHLGAVEHLILQSVAEHLIQPLHLENQFMLPDSFFQLLNLMACQIEVIGEPTIIMF